MTTDCTGRHAERCLAEKIVPGNHGEAFPRGEIELDHRSERVLIPKAILALAVVAALVVLREVFFV
ncbi:hypothetical protein [Lacisediminihabitans sp.]|uniref:hypothetical protein n=1 Tax=Lacisediminihabitans sp. TaxID=2787631 RepID=UPI00374CB030